jgi:cyclopropane fatty-acyl-phospholipid synthase-like methyltransferase
MDFYNDPSKVAEYIQMCDEYDGSNLYEILEASLKQSSSLLELGSGPGNDLEYLSKNFQVTGSDLSDEFIKRNKETHPSISFFKLDAVNIEIDKTFDCLFSNKVLHHLTKEKLEQSLQRQTQVITNKGLFAHTFWLADKEFEMEGMLFVFYDKDELIQMVSKYFTIEKLYEYDEFEANDSLFILARNDKN